MRGIAGTRRGKLRPRKATAEELGYLDRNFAVVAIYYDLSDEAIDVAWDAAIGSPSKAARCYAAIVRSL